jgi:hypothetical protein
MINVARTDEKVKKGQALNLSELAYASGYERGVLAQMNLPLQAKKMSLPDFQRIMRKRQDWQERALRQPRKKSDEALRPPTAGGDQKREASDTFYGRSSKRAGKGASRQPQQFQLQGSG